MFFSMFARLRKTTCLSVFLSGVLIGVAQNVKVDSPWSSVPFVWTAHVGNGLCGRSSMGETKLVPPVLSSVELTGGLQSETRRRCSISSTYPRRSARR